MKIGTYVELVMRDYNAFDEGQPYRGIVVPLPSNPLIDGEKGRRRKCVAVRWIGYPAEVYYYPMDRLKVLSTVPVS